MFSNSSNVNPAFFTNVRMAPSVGSPMSLYVFVSFELLQRVPIKAVRRRDSRVCLSSLFSKIPVSPFGLYPTPFIPTDNSFM